jgi:hypothetical protein
LTFLSSWKANKKLNVAAEDVWVLLPGEDKHTSWVLTKLKQSSYGKRERDIPPTYQKLETHRDASESRKCLRGTAL